MPGMAQDLRCANADEAAAPAAASPRVGVIDAIGRRLLDSVIDITAEHDHARFRASFRETVGELLEVDEVAFVRPVRDRAGRLVFQDVCEPTPLRWLGPRPLAQWRPWLQSQHVDDMVATGQALLVETGSTTLALPVIHRDVLVEIILVRARSLPTEAFYMLRAFARLYRNFLALIMATERDALTGLFNRRTLETRLAQLTLDAGQRHALSALEPGDRRGAGVCRAVAMLDVDRFKRINDGFGHLFGDEVLLLVSRLMREVLRDEDMLFRYGGEEFCAVLICDRREDAIAALERFREAIANHEFPRIGQVTISAGVAQMLPDELPAAAIARADRALYCAKERGRNRVIDYDRAVESGWLKPEVKHSDVELF